MKILLDKYYTPVDTAKELIELTYNTLGKGNILDVIEPSAGAGSFSSQIDGCRAYDIEPEADGIIKADFLTSLFNYKQGRLVIGNPPFGRSNALIYKFLNKAADIGDYIAFILPISMLNNIVRFYRFDLVVSKDLGIKTYSGVDLHCCFNIYKRPLNGEHLNAPNYRELMKDIVEIREVRRMGIDDYQIGKAKPITDDFDFGMCNWGSGCLGKRPTHIGEFAQEVYFYCNPKYRDQIDRLCEFDTIRAFVSGISAKKISVMRLYQYLYENIRFLE